MTDHKPNLQQPTEELGRQPGGLASSRAIIPDNRSASLYTTTPSSTDDHERPPNFWNPPSVEGESRAPRVQPLHLSKTRVRYPKLSLRPPALRQRTFETDSIGSRIPRAKPRDKIPSPVRIAHSVSERSIITATVPVRESKRTSKGRVAKVKTLIRRVFVCEAEANLSKFHSSQKGPLVESTSGIPLSPFSALRLQSNQSESEEEETRPPRLRRVPRFRNLTSPVSTSQLKPTQKEERLSSLPVLRPNSPTLTSLAPTFPAPTFPSPTFPSPTFPAPTFPAPSLPVSSLPAPAPALPAPALPAPTSPAPTSPIPTSQPNPSETEVEQTSYTLAKMDTRDSLFLDPAVAAITKHKAEAIKLARDQGVAVQEMCRRADTEVPPYEFEELIGKGAYGRVYKGIQKSTDRVVAIKVLDIDSLDYSAIRDLRDESIKDFIHETKVMKQVKDSGAKNINELIEAISMHSQLWLVCEYCPGGSVRTLMRATNDKLDEKFIIPIARELAIGLRAIHEAGVIHRDIKAANILVHEEGRLEICDFGVAGILQSQRDKRSTWIGTPHWMPPEMFATRGEAHRYGSEVDVWAYGCTLFEFATGNPPNSGLRDRMHIGRQLNRKTPQLEKDGYSQGLKDLIAFALDPNPETRPMMKDILAHPYIANTEEGYPTESVTELIKNYYQWSQRGGQRTSLFQPGGAAAAELPGVDDFGEDWSFSTTDGFQKRFSVVDLDQIAATLARMEQPPSPTSHSPEPDTNEEFSEGALNYEDKLNFDERVRRGAEAMEGLFNGEKPIYKYETKNDFVPIEMAQPTSDLPLRADTDRSSVTSTFLDIDIGSFEASHYAAGAPSAQPFQLVDADTIRATRSSIRLHRNSDDDSSKSSEGSVADNSSHNPNLDDTFVPSGPRPPTMDWKFPSFGPPEDDPPEEKEQPTAAPIEEDSVRAEKRATMQWTFPVMGSVPDSQVYEDRHDTLRAPLPALSEATASPPESKHQPNEARPSTSASNVSDSDYANNSDSEYDPFRFDRPDTPPGTSSLHHSHFFDTVIPRTKRSVGYTESESSGLLDGPGPDEESNPIWKQYENSGYFSDALAAADPSPSSPPTAIQTPETPTAASVTSGPVSEPGSPVLDAVRPTRDESFSLPHPWIPRVPTDDSHVDAYPPSPAGYRRILFPYLAPPSAASLMEGADDATMTAELERLLDEFTMGLSATGQALAGFDMDQDTRGGPGRGAN
ncbi:unnamed protein product [Penicillium olsonii]|nr:unnamed protein product [Penicillium olsonii]